MVPVDRLLGAVLSLGHGLWKALAYWTISIFATEGVEKRSEEGTQLLLSPHRGEGHTQYVLH